MRSKLSAFVLKLHLELDPDLAEWLATGALRRALAIVQARRTAAALLPVAQDIED